MCRRKCVFGLLVLVVWTLSSVPVGLEAAQTGVCEEAYQEAGALLEQAQAALDEGDEETGLALAQDAFDLLLACRDETGEAVFFPAGSGGLGWTPVVQEFDGVEMVLVPAGCFMMGSTEEQIDVALQQCNEERGDCDRAWFENEGPAHCVCFEEPFWIDRFEVSNAQFAAFDGAPALLREDAQPDRPRDGLTWFEARDYCAQRGGRLPTEAEWEYTARGPDAWVYPWGNEWDQSLVIGYRDWYEGTVSVGSIPEGASWVGALDMSGNVLEWVGDWYDADYYGTLADGVVNPTGPETDEYREDWGERVLRGGSWAIIFSRADDFRAAVRYWYLPWYGYNAYFHLLGFRCARSR